MKILVTGGTGFIGARLVQMCRERGDEVRVLAQANTAAEEANLAGLRADGVAVTLGSITDPAAVGAAVEGMQQVFHLAAAQHEAGRPDEHFRQVNIEGTRFLLEAAATAGVQRFVHGSTIGVYGSLEGEISETSECRPDNIYGRSKLDGEAVVAGFARRLPVVTVRISETYGPGDRRLLKLFRAIHSGMFFMMGPGTNLHQLIFVDDLVEGMLAAARSSGSGEIFLLGGPERLSTNEMASAIGEALGKPPWRFRAPLWPFTTTAVVLEALCRPLGIQPPLHPRRMDFFRKTFTLDTGRAAARIGFRPAVKFREGVARTLAGYREAGLM
ncbi:MAG: NAD-dependent epimerase/dehydratase family protein [Gammaproteobacteria bacterium]|nr:NAD-dependent epimerase/dehydratase family protein [Gammaproteobacteria bacterium]